MLATTYKPSTAASLKKANIMNGTTNGTLTNGSVTNGASVNGAQWNGDLKNGASLNGTHTNRTISKDNVANGTATNGTAINGTSKKGIGMNGCPTNTAVKNILLNGTNGRAPTSNGTSMNGLPLNSIATNGASQNGNLDLEGGDLLKMVLEMVLQAKLVTGLTAQDKLVEFKQPDELREELDLDIGEGGCCLEEARAVLSQAVRYSVRTQHPHFFNQLYGGIDEVALTGAWMTEALNTNQYTYEVAPVFILVEHQVASWLTSLFGFPQGDAIFAPGGSISNMYAMVLARYRHQPDIKRKGIFSQKPLVAFTSDQGHYSISKSAAWLGIGMDNVIAVPSDAQGKMRAGALKEAIKAARAMGAVPFFVNATAATTVLGAYDPLDELADVCQEEGLWLHVDGCWGGSAILSEKHKHLLKGVHRVDSVSWNPHKMLGVSLQCSAFVTRHKLLLQECNSARATYLFQQDKYYDTAYDTGDKSVQCGRKVDAFKFWLFLKLHGLATLRDRIDQAFVASRYLSQQVEQREGFRLLQEPECTNVCFWFIPPSMRGQEETSEWWVRLAKVAPECKARMVKAGTMMIGYQPLANKNLVNIFRMVTTCTPVPKLQDMDFVLDEIERLGADL